MGPPCVHASQLVFLFIFFIIWFPQRFAIADEQFSSCEPFNCGNLTSLSFPFWSASRPEYCGHPSFKLDCEGDNASMNMASQNFRVMDVQTSSRTLTIARTDLWGTICPNEFHNTTLDYAFFNYTSNDVNSIILYDCDFTEYPPLPVNLSTNINMIFECPIDGSNRRQAYFLIVGDNWYNQTALGCGIRITVPVLGEAARRFIEDAIVPGEAISQGFEVEWELREEKTCDDCRGSGGRCGYDVSSGGFTCFCPNQSYQQDGFCFPPDAVEAQTPEPSETGTRRLSIRNKIIVGVATAAAAIAAIGLLRLCITLCGCKNSRAIIGLRKASKVDQNIEAFIRNHGFLALTRYKFADVKKMTNSFKENLGKGGYGSVYKGKLLNGCPVAVKVLKASNESGEDFINEVASISRTSHVNVVTLLGFCFEGKRKALIYEFMSNGSLDRFIHDSVDKNNVRLTWENLCEIAIGIARGLEYLHRGCNTRILHFDIKPHNILLDENMCPKISDFGLAKLCLKRESIISISEARGTIGYLAPEVLNRSIGGVSHKSDVYSYGMMLLDMVGGRKNRHVETNYSTEKYFPDYIYDQLEQGSSLGCNGPNNTGENNIAKRMTIVGLWCIQTFPSQRPTMSRVIKMLERRLDLLEMPPKPVMPSPPRLELESSTTTSSTTGILGFHRSSHMKIEEH